SVISWAPGARRERDCTVILRACNAIYFRRPAVSAGTIFSTQSGQTSRAMTGAIHDRLESIRSGHAGGRLLLVPRSRLRRAEGRAVSGVGLHGRRSGSAEL